MPRQPRERGCHLAGGRRDAGGVLHGEPAELCPCVPRARTEGHLGWAEPSGWYCRWHGHPQTPSARQSPLARGEWAAGRLPGSLGSVASSRLSDLAQMRCKRLPAEENGWGKQPAAATPCQPAPARKGSTAMASQGLPLRSSCLPLPFSVVKGVIKSPLCFASPRLVVPCRPGLVDPAGLLPGHLC